MQLFSDTYDELMMTSSFFRLPFGPGFVSAAFTCVKSDLLTEDLLFLTWGEWPDLLTVTVDSESQTVNEGFNDHPLTRVKLSGFQAENLGYLRLSLVIEAVMFFRRDRRDPDNDVMYYWSLHFLLQFNNWGWAIPIDGFPFLLI